MTADWPLSPWVEERRERVSFGLQIFPIDTKIDPARHLLATGKLAEALGFDALFLADHPAWALECWAYMAALAVTTSRIRLGTNVVVMPFRHPVMTARLAFVVALTPAEAAAFFQTYADVGIQHFIVETLDAADTETIRLLAEEVMPHVSRS